MQNWSPFGNNGISEKDGTGVERDGTGVEKDGTGVEKDGTGIRRRSEKHGTGCRGLSVLLMAACLAAAPLSSIADDTPWVEIQDGNAIVVWDIKGRVFDGAGTLRDGYALVALHECKLGLKSGGDGTGDKSGGDGTGEKSGGDGTGDKSGGDGTGEKGVFCTGVKSGGDGTGDKSGGDGTGEKSGGDGTGDKSGGDGTGESAIGQSPVLLAEVVVNCGSVDIYVHRLFTPDDKQLLASYVNLPVIADRPAALRCDK